MTRLLAVKTKTGDAVHVSVEGFLGRTLCGRRPAFRLPDLDDSIRVVDGAGIGAIQHPFGCEPCGREAARILREEDR